MNLLFFASVTFVLICNIFVYGNSIKKKNEGLTRAYNSIFSSNKALDNQVGIFNAGQIYHKTSIKCCILLVFSFVPMRLLFSLKLSNFMQIIAYFVVFIVVLVSYMLILNDAKKQVVELSKQMKK